MNWSVILLGAAVMFCANIDSRREEAPYRDFHSFVTLYNSNSKKIFCGGTMINRCTIVTAARCIMVAYIEVQTGDHYSTNVNLKWNVEVENVIPHPEFNSSTLENDIAILKIPHTYDVYDGFSISTQDITPNQSCTAIGIGDTSFGDSYPVYDFLQQAPVPAYEGTYCATHRNICKTNLSDVTNQIVAGIPGIDGCLGDTGDPLYCTELGNRVLAGIVSYGTCGILNYPRVYTKVSNYQDFIKEHYHCLL